LAAEAATVTDWLPDLLDVNGDWHDLLEAAYAIYERDLVRGRRAQVGGLVVHPRVMPIENNKHDSFWHVVGQVDASTQERFPDLLRLSHISWVRPVLDAAGTARTCCWKTPAKRGRGFDVTVALPDFSYGVVIQHRRGTNGRPDYFNLATAYPIRNPPKVKWESEFARFGSYL
jgi:hypothetical protein